MSEKIFVSYAYQDRDLLVAVERALRQRGIVNANEVFLDPNQELQPERPLREMLMEFIRSASKVVVIASDNSAKSQWVNYEVGMAAALDKPIVVVGRKGTLDIPFLRGLGEVQSIEIEENGLLEVTR